MPTPALCRARRWPSGSRRSEPARSARRNPPPAPRAPRRSGAKDHRHRPTQARKSPVLTATQRLTGSCAARSGNSSRSVLTARRRKRLRAVCPCSPWHRAMCPHGPRQRGSNGLQTGRSTSLGWQGQDGPICPLFPCCGSPQGPPCAKPASLRVSTPTRPLWASPPPLSNDRPQSHYGSRLPPVAARFRGSFLL